MENKSPLSKVEEERDAIGAVKSKSRKDIALNALQDRLIQAN